MNPKKKKQKKYPNEFDYYFKPLIEGAVIIEFSKLLK